MKKLSTNKIILGLVLLFTVVSLILIFTLSSKGQKESAKTTISYKTSDAQKPIATVSSVFFDLGKMKVSDEKKATFVIENTGNKPLSLFKISSSCGCTVGTVEIEGVKSPEFGMHSNSLWSTNLDPGKKANIEVIYRPYIMPVSGEVTRDVYVQTNDPDKPSLTFTVKADVE